MKIKRCIDLISVLTVAFLSFVFISRAGDMPEILSSDLLFQTGEFNVVESPGNTIQVRKKEDFPERLEAGQRIALFLDDIPADKHLVLSVSLLPVNADEKSDARAVEILMNEKTIFKKQIQGTCTELNMFIPSNVVEINGNILQIRNIGIHPLTFRKLNLSCFVFPKTVELASSRLSLPYGAMPLFAGASPVYQEKILKFVPCHVSDRLKDGVFFDMSAVFKNRKYCDPVSNEPCSPYYGYKTASKLYEGTPSVIPICLESRNAESLLSSVSWAAVVNSDGIVTAQVSAVREPDGDMRLSLPVPWSGKTKCRITTGFIPPELAARYPLSEKMKTEEKSVDISNGVFEVEFNLSSCTTFRLIKDGVSEPPPVFPPDCVLKNTKAVFQRGFLKVDAKRQEMAYPIRTGIRSVDRASLALSSNYAIRKIDATRCDIGGTRGIVPYDKKSDLVEISFKDGVCYPCDGASLYFSRVPENYQEFSFWVYPRIELSAQQQALKRPQLSKKVAMQFYIENGKGIQFMAADLRLDEWQRVVLPSDKFILPKTGKICIVGDPKIPEYAKGNKVSFELNGFSALGNEHPDKGISGLIKSRIVCSQKGLLAVLVGRRGAYFEFRHPFKEPVDMKGISELGGFKGLGYLYKRDAQILEISGRFPDDAREIPEQAINLLTAEETGMIARQNLSFLLVKSEFDK